MNRRAFMILAALASPIVKLVKAVQQRREKYIIHINWSDGTATVFSTFLETQADGSPWTKEDIDKAEFGFRTTATGHEPFHVERKEWAEWKQD